MDKIKIDQLEIYAYHGVFPEEKEKGQRFYLNVEIETDFREAAKEDKLEKSINYGEICERMEKTFTKESSDLIEAAAWKTAEDLLLHFPKIQKVTLEVRKPEAPIPMKFDSVSVELSLEWHKVYLAFGSNLGDKEKYIRDGIQQLKEGREFRKIEVSDFYCSRAYGGVKQGSFVNGVLYVETYLTPYELLDRLHAIEKMAGRERNIHWGPRTLDLDILFYDQLILEEKDLQIPHKDMINRDFVLLPLIQIAPYLRHPIYGKTVEEMAKELEESYIIKKN